MLGSAKSKARAACAGRPDRPAACAAGRTSDDGGAPPGRAAGRAPAVRLAPDALDPRDVLDPPDRREAGPSAAAGPLE